MATTLNSEECQWIRLQEVGIVLLLMPPVAVLVTGLIFGFTITSPIIANILLMVILGLLCAGVCCLRYGDEKRQKLKDKE